MLKLFGQALPHPSGAFEPMFPADATIQAATPAAASAHDRRGLLMTALRLAAGGAAAFAVASLSGSRAFALAVPGPDDIAQPPAAYPALFDSQELVLGNPLRFLPKAQALIDALNQPAGEGDLADWDALIDGLAGADAMTRIEEVNRFVNDVPYVDDRRNWGVADRWAAPAEFFAQGGDCEDFALAKFVSLYRLGFNVARLRMVLAKDQRKRLDHCFLAVYLGERAYVLDNQIKTVTPHEAISHYRPLCSFNDHRLWMHRS
jgi:predicted transglutaminase-like cysteine proteinase